MSLSSTSLMPLKSWMDNCTVEGAVDMKSGTAAMVMGAGMLAAEKVQMHGDLIVAALAGQEVDSLGDKVFCREWRTGGIGAIIVGEPTNLEVAAAHKGAHWLE